MTDIIAGVQDAEASVRVLERALSEAQSLRHPLRVLTAWSTPVLLGDMSGMGYAGAYIDTTASGEAAKELADELLDKALHEGRWDASLVTSTEARPGDPGQVITDAAGQAELVVVGGRSHGPVASALLGSTTGYVLHHAPCPVMVVPATTAPGPFLRIIVGIDGTECSRSALRWAHAAAARHHCPLVVLYANDNLPLPGVPLVSSSQVEATALAWLSVEVAEVLPDKQDVPVLPEVATGPAARVLLAKAGPDDLLVVGSRGRGGFLDLVLGSVAMQCTSHARGAVVVVR
ncbi:MAG: hypothetical protein JWO12_244 [Frankiales bacterium]|nr:hypothetical protein [Frankiales bacterium]